ncbi:F-box/LRR-repeat protein 3-like [Rhododendron vialii]|uniref:F-box/LRR-repeat protein 3-like n=1 Tax=Rhododendron vialii TaxID=182163 RepID=UPI00265F2DE8|nr:F-box/LRR-repeat protein 3-like [Rhododendron vialii]
MDRVRARNLFLPGERIAVSERSSKYYVVVSSRSFLVFFTKHGRDPQGKGDGGDGQNPVRRAPRRSPPPPPAAFHFFPLHRRCLPRLQAVAPPLPLFQIHNLSPPHPRQLYAPIPLLFPLSLPPPLLPPHHHLLRSSPLLRRLFLYPQADTSLPPTQPSPSLPSPLSLHLMPSPHFSLISLSPSLSFHWLLHFPSLQQLDVVFASLPTEFEYVDAASKGNNLDGELKLETLTLEGIGRGNYNLDGLWKSCKKLNKLQLRRCHGIGDDTSVSSFNNCLKGLQEVELRCCGSIVNDILTRLVESCTSLNSLLIRSRDYGYREGLLQFITHSSCNLQKLDLYLPHDLQDNHLLAVAEKFSGLLFLRLENCLLVSHEGLTTMALAMSNSNKLEELALIYCNMEPGLLTTLGQSFRNLRKLDLSYSYKLADEEFILMLASLNCLRELNVRGCEGLTNASVVSMF